MSSNESLENTTAYNESETSILSVDWSLYWDLYEYFSVPVTILTAIIVFYEIISWSLIKKWRTYKNFVFTNVSAAAFLKHLVQLIINESYFSGGEISFQVLYILYILAIFAYNLWLLMLSVLFYSTIVNILKPPVHGRFWKSALLGWGTPAFTGVTNYLYKSIAIESREDYLNFLVFCLSCLISVAILIMYVIVIRTLLKRKSIRSSSHNVRANFQLATLLLIMGGFTSLAIYIIGLATNEKTTLALVIDDADLLPSIAIAIWVFIAKSNRVLWQEYRNRLRH